MTTTKAREVNLKPGQKVQVGRNSISVTEFTVTCEGITWTFYRNSNDEWFQGCGNCDYDSGFKAVYAGIYGGVCFQCGGAGVVRVAGSELALIRLVRTRTSSRLGRANAVERAAERARAGAEAWSVRNPNLASDLARVRAQGGHERRDTGPLIDLALAAVRGPLSERQAAYATRLLAQAAYAEAFAALEPPHTYAGEKGELVEHTGVVKVNHYCPAERFDRTATMLIVIEVRTPSAVYSLKMSTAARWAFDLAKGDTITVRGTIKKLEDGRWGKQTSLTRPKRIDTPKEI